jgi:Tol biopolymer transport system component/imidazolonepropionase-like amidohydrolase
MYTILRLITTHRFLRGPAVLSCASLALLVGRPAPAAPPKQTVTITEGTNMAATVSPDRKTVILGLHTRLWSVPIAGGPAKALTDPLLDAARPDWSPKGDLVTFEAYSGGTFHIWIMKPDGSGVRQLTNGHGDDREPRFSPDGTKIAFSSDRAFKGSYDVWVVDVGSGKLTQRTSGPDDEYEPAWSPDGTEIAFVSGVGVAGTTILAVNARGTQRTLATAAPGSHVNSPSWTLDGKSVVYEQFAANKTRLIVSGEPLGDRNDVFPFPPTWLSDHEILYTANGKICVSKTGSGDTREIPFQAQITLDRPPFKFKKFDFDSSAPKQVKGIVGPAISPDGKRVVFQAANQLWLMEVGKAPQPLTNDAFYKADPAWSPDGTRIAYSSDKAGTEDIYILDLASKAEKRATSLADSAEFSAAWSPDGKALAFQDQTGSTYTLDLDSGKIRKIIGVQFEPSKPSWSANGKTIAISAVKAYTRRFREGTSQILTADVATGAVTYTEPAPFKSLSTRGEDGPVYSPDGSAMAFVMESLLWVRPVDSNGLPAGGARPITNEATDAPTWTGDSKHLLYLSNGKLRLVGVDGSAPQTLSLELTVKRDQPTGQVFIHAGRLWDGRGADERTDVDILVVHNRIRSVEPHSEAAQRAAAGRNDQIVDASNLTVLPGLWEAHTHEWMSGKPYGDRLGRLWLAYGVTSLHSQGDPAYRAVETREASDSGARLGPRFFATGEAIDGERVFYNFMRPTTSEAQLARELSRAQALEYDSLKTYVRLPHAMQKETVAFAHEKMGVVVASHYMLPGMAYGMDGMTHVSATSRYGFAFTRSAGGVSYEDMRKLFVASGMFDISTAFMSLPLYAEDPKMVDDVRLTTLNTPWDEAVLRTKRDRAADQDQTVTLDSLKKEEETVAAILHAGGIMLAGTDSPIDSVATALHLGLRAQVKFGLPAWQALQTATLLPAKAFGVGNDLGTIEPGKLADLIIVAGDPLRDIKDLAKVQGVMRNGRFYSVPDLLAPFAKH